MKPYVVFGAVVLSALAAYHYWQKREERKLYEAGIEAPLRICNLVPLNVNTEVLSSATVEPRRGANLLKPHQQFIKTSLLPGECQSITLWNAGYNVSQEVFLGGHIDDKRIFLITEAEESPFLGAEAPTTDILEFWRSLPLYENRSIINQAFDYVQIYTPNGHTHIFTIEGLLPSPEFSLDTLPFEQSRAAALSKSLDRQRNMEPIYTNPSWPGMPYLIGIVAEEDDPHRLGVKLESVSEDWPAHFAGIRTGDILLEAFGQSIYSIADLHALLLEHAEKYGVEKGFSISLLRGENTYTTQLTYMFNPNLHPYSEYEKNLAFWYGALDSASLGIEITTACTAKAGGKAVVNAVKRLIYLFSDDEAPPTYSPIKFQQCYFETTQLVARLRQFYPESFKDGNFAGMFAPTGELVAVGKLLGINKALKTSKLPEIKGATYTITREIVEGAVWEIAGADEATPISEISDNVKSSVPFSFGIGVAQRALVRRNR